MEINVSLNMLIHKITCLIFLYKQDRYLYIAIKLSSSF